MKPHHCPTQLVLVSGIVAALIACICGIIWAQVTGRPLDNALVTLASTITGIVGTLLVRPSPPTQPPAPGTHSEVEVKTTTNTPPTP